MSGTPSSASDVPGVAVIRAPPRTCPACGVRPPCGSPSSACGARPRPARRPCARRGRAPARACDGWPAAPRLRRPSSRAARTAQPGSPSWRQSLKRQVAASSAMSSNAASTPSSAPATSSARMPGVSMSSAPPGSSNSSRWVVVWRPRESILADRRGGLALLAEERVRRASTCRRPTSPGRPRSGPGRGTARGRRADRRSARRARRSARAGAIDSTSRRRPSRSIGDVRLVEDDDRPHAARPGDREVALEPAQVEVVVEAGDQERDVDVGGEDLLVGEVACRPPARVGRTANERRSAGKDGGDRRSGHRARPHRRERARATQSPTAG